MKRSNFVAECIFCSKNANKESKYFLICDVNYVYLKLSSMLKFFVYVHTILTISSPESKGKSLEDPALNFKLGWRQLLKNMNDDDV